jgi:hypothetical protein
MLWMIVRSDDGEVLARFSSKPKALAAAIHFGKDGHEYRVAAEQAQATPPPSAVGIRMGVFAARPNRVPPRGH